jgi:hypothetical protein
MIYDVDRPAELALREPFLLSKARGQGDADRLGKF